MLQKLFFSLLYLALVLIPTISFSKEEKIIKYEDDSIVFRIVRRSPKQIAAFYEGRGFDKKAIEELQKTCGIAVIVQNKTDDILWLELDNWQFYTRDKVGGSDQQQLFARFNRDYWQKQWQKINLSPAHRSTFGWTLMPELRDLRPDEGVGGNVTLPYQTKEFSIKALFHTGPTKQGKDKLVTLDKIRCLSDDEVK